MPATASSRLGPANDLVAGNPQQVVTQVDIQGVRLLGDDLAGDPLPSLRIRVSKPGPDAREPPGKPDRQSRAVSTSASSLRSPHRNAS